mgnify:CR=1 FL=1
MIYIGKDPQQILWDITKELWLTHKIPIYKETMHEEPKDTPNSYILLRSEITDTDELKGDGIGLMWSSNYSIGVNLLFALNKQLAKFMEAYPNYTPHMTEVHHIHKLDAPSGTAKTLQEAIGEERLPVADIESIREGEVPGIHTVTWDSDVDTITISQMLVIQSRYNFTTRNFY